MKTTSLFSFLFTLILHCSTFQMSSGQFYFIENDYQIVVEAENVFDTNGWDVEQENNGYSGEGYLIWKDSPYLHSPGYGILEYKIVIKNTGTYIFKWHSKVGKGGSSTEHNDTWLRIPDADDFYGEKNGDIVHPHGICTNNCPNGSGSSGWFKIYSSGTTSWTWTAYTSDSDAHSIYARFDTPGIYTVQFAARSDYHCVDRFIMYQPTHVSSNEATSEDNPLSEQLFEMAHFDDYAAILNEDNTLKISNIHESVTDLDISSSDEEIITATVSAIDAGRNAEIVIKALSETTQNDSITLNIENSLVENCTFSFEIPVIPFINKPPTIAPVQDIETDFSEENYAVTLSNISDGNDGSQDISFSVSRSNSRVIAIPYVSYQQQNNEAILYIPLRGTGTSDISLVVVDNGGIAMGGNDRTELNFTITVNETASAIVSDNKLLNVKVHPNPVMDYLYIDTDMLRITKVEILDSSGVIQFIEEDSAVQEINISSLPKGFYIIRCIDENKKQYFRKIMKQ